MSRSESGVAGPPGEATRHAAGETPPPTVVFAPDLVGYALHRAEAAAVLTQWRDGKLRPALNRELLLRYLKLLRQLGLTETQLRRWGWWFTAPGKSCFLETEFPDATGVVELCQALGRAAGARCIVYGGKRPEWTAPGAGGDEAVRWISAAEYTF